jgi:hypothetical protein
MAGQQDCSPWLIGLLVFFGLLLLWRFLTNTAQEEDTTWSSCARDYTYGDDPLSPVREGMQSGVLKKKTSSLPKQKPGVATTTTAKNNKSALVLNKQVSKKATAVRSAAAELETARTKLLKKRRASGPVVTNPSQ